MSKPLILITNDDGITAKGIKSLKKAMEGLGELIIVAPDSPQSGKGHAITISDPLRIREEKVYGVKAYSCTGTPVDCVKIAIYHILKRKPDLLVSGINHGSNASTNVIYSGTMSAAVEGAIENIPSVGFSLLDYDADADFDASIHYARKIAKRLLEMKNPNHVCLNVNIPKGKLSDLKGLKVCRQGMASWEDTFDVRKDQFGRDYFWLTGEFKEQEQAEDTDMHALANGFVSVVPTQFDLTAYNELKTYKEIEKI
jgi:5'-nucleotidase